VIFKPVMIHKIAAGQKTQTRRRIRTPEPTWTVGRAYAAQPGRGKPASLHFIVTEIRRERLADLTFEDARREGFKTRDDFFEYWADLYGGTPNPDLEVWVLTFRRDDRDMPRLLAARMGRGDYVTDPHQAARDEPEAITSDEHARLFEHAAAKDDARRRQPLASSMDNLRRELDALRERITDENLQDARLRRAIDRVEYHAEQIAKRLAA
jgi:hypothetical protein